MRHRSSRPDRGYAAIPNSAMRDEELSIEARGMLALLMTYSDEWEFHADHLQKIARIGRDKFAGIMRELKEHGYVTRETKRNDSGQLAGSQWVIRDDPHRATEKAFLGGASALKNRLPAQPTAGESAPLRRPTVKEDKLEGSKASKKISFTEDWQPDLELCAWAKGLGFDEVRIRREATLCALHQIGRGERFVDLGAVFKAWLLRAKNFDEASRKTGLSEKPNDTKFMNRLNARIEEHARRAGAR